MFMNHSSSVEDDKAKIICVTNLEAASFSSCNPQKPCGPDDTDPPDAPDSCSPDCGPHGNCRPDCCPYD